MNALLAITEFIGEGFDYKAALVVALVAAIVVLGVVVIAMSAGVGTPAVLAGLSAAGPLISAVAGIALTAGVVAGVVSGWGRQAKADEKPPDPVLRAVNELDIAFEPSDADPKQARDFTAVVVRYHEDGKKTAEQRRTIREERNDAFYTQVETQLDDWLGHRTCGDDAGKCRRVCVYMNPYPGDGVYEKIKGLCERRPNVVVSRVEAPWSPASE